MLHLRSLKGNERMGIMDEVGNGHGLYHEEETLPPSRQSRPVLVLVCVHCTLARVNQLDHVLNRLGVVPKNFALSCGGILHTKLWKPDLCRVEFFACIEQRALYITLCALFQSTYLHAQLVALAKCTVVKPVVCTL